MIAEGSPQPVEGDLSGEPLEDDAVDLLPSEDPRTTVLFPKRQGKHANCQRPEDFATEIWWKFLTQKDRDEVLKRRAEESDTARSLASLACELGIEPTSFAIMSPADRRCVIDEKLEYLATSSPLGSAVPSRLPDSAVYSHLSSVPVGAAAPCPGVIVDTQF